MSTAAEPDLILRSLEQESGLSATARRVARFINDNRPLALACSAADLAQRLSTSDATVIRSIQAMGFDTLAELRAALVASLDNAVTPASALRRTIDEIGCDIGDAIETTLRVQEESLHALRDPETREQIAAAVRRLYGCRRIVVYGVGPSRALADYVSKLLNRHGNESFAIGTGGIAFADELQRLNEDDGLIVMAYNRLYHEIDILFRHARRLDLPVVLMTEQIGTEAPPPGTTVICAPRGREGYVALRAATVAALETLVTTLAIAHRDRTIASLDRLVQLREDLDLTSALRPTGRRRHR